MSVETFQSERPQFNLFIRFVATAVLFCFAGLIVLSLLCAYVQHVERARRQARRDEIRKRMQEMPVQTLEWHKLIHDFR